MTSVANKLDSAGTETKLWRRPYGWFGTFTAMASPCEVHVAGANQAIAQQVLDAVETEAARIEGKFSRYCQGNAVDCINRSNGATVTIDDETAALLSYADALFKLSDGRFDITSGILRHAWQFDGGDKFPAAKSIRRLMKHVGWHRVNWNPPELKLAEGMEIDFGGIGKEYAADRAGMIAAKIWPNCLINFGGDLLATGMGIDASGWMIGVEGLSVASVPAKRIRLTKGGIATSGDARRYLLRNGKRLSHILDPRTGWPVENAPRSVTVAAPTCTQAGMLATFGMLQGGEAENYLALQDVKFWCQR